MARIMSESTRTQTSNLERVHSKALPACRSLGSGREHGCLFLFFLPPFTIWLILLFLPLSHSISSETSSHPKIALKGIDGAPLSIDGTAPYSPMKTCGGCHDYDRITKGYHFQQGRTDGAGKIIISDAFDRKYPWNLSAGLYGRHFLASPDSSQLARKMNQHPSEIDKSSFFFVQECGGCHPGGGWAEYDRNGNLYYNEELKKFGFEISSDGPRLDGDYTPFSMGNADHGAPWDRSGVSEADCLICHLRKYRWKERGEALKASFFKYAPAVGAGWATLMPPQDPSGEVKTAEIRVDYARKETASFDDLHLEIVRKPPDESCWFCHAGPGGRKRGRQWTPESDVHKAKGLECLTCHPGDKEHNFAKGNTLQETVRNDLDGTMPSCEDCHVRGKGKKGTRYRHPFSPRHLKRIACQTCHIPFQSAPADLVHDHASSGETVVYPTSKFLSGNPVDPKMPGVGPDTWYPAVREFNGRIIPVKPLIAIYWGDLDEETNVVRPLFLWKIRELKKPPLKDDDGDGISEINTIDEIKAFLNALKGKDRFGNPVAQCPVLIKGGLLYRLDKKGEVEKVKHDQADPLDFSISHNVTSGVNVIGSRGCKDCHTRNSPFFLRKVLVDPISEKGSPVYVEAWERLGIDREKLGSLLLEQ